MELSVLKSTISSIQVVLASLFSSLDLKVSLVQHLQGCHGHVPSRREEATYSASCWFTLPERKLGMKNSAFKVWESASVSCKVIHNALALDNYNPKLYWKPGDFNLNCIKGQKKITYFLQHAHIKKRESHQNGERVFLHLTKIKCLEDQGSSHPESGLRARVPLRGQTNARLCVLHQITTG